MLLGSLASTCAFLAAAISPAIADPSITGDLFTNGQEGFPDPCVLKDPVGGKYYIYADQARIAFADDLRGSFTKQTYKILNADGSSHTIGDSNQSAGSPSVGYVDGKYVLYYSEGQKIWVATGSSPLGPFNLTGAPLLMPPQQDVDGGIAFPAAPALFQHEGSNYMLYKYGRAGDYDGVSSICIQRLSNNGLTKTSDAPAQLFTVTAGVEWNGQQFSEDEGPSMVYHDGLFHLFFNVGTWCANTYRIAHATSGVLMPSSPYEYRGIFLQSKDYPNQEATLLAPGGISFVDDTHFIFMSFEPGTSLFCQGSPKPPRNVRAGQLVYQANGTTSPAVSWSN